MKQSWLRFAYALLAVLALVAVSAGAQTPAPVAPPPPDFSKVEITTTKVNDNLYLLDGLGGRIGVLAGPDGVLMVDSQYAPLSEKILAAIRKISSGPIRYMINTHLHGDHTGGNENFGKMGVTIFARDELRQGLAFPVPYVNGITPPVAPAKALPMVTYRGQVTFHMNGEVVEAIPIPRAHTGGDTLVRFRNADLLMVGDFFRLSGYPNIDRGNGGSLQGMIDGLGATIGMSGPNTKIVPGHGPIVDRNSIAEHRDMILVVRDRVKKLTDQGKTLNEIYAAKVTADYDGKTLQPETTGPRFVGQVYTDLTAK